MYTAHTGVTADDSWATHWVCVEHELPEPESLLERQPAVRALADDIARQRASRVGDRLIASDPELRAQEMVGRRRKLSARAASYTVVNSLLQHLRRSL